MSCCNANQACAYLGHHLVTVTIRCTLLNDYVLSSHAQSEIATAHLHLQHLCMRCMATPHAMCTALAQEDAHSCHHAFYFFDLQLVTALPLESSRLLLSVPSGQVSVVKCTSRSSSGAAESSVKCMHEILAFNFPSQCLI